MPFACHLIATSEVEIKLNKENTGEKSYIDLIPEISVNSIEL